MLKPRALRSGDRIAVVAPASPFKREEFDAGIAELTRLGFDPVYDESVFDTHRYVAGTPEVRAAAIRAAWDDPSVAGLIGVRGGYGSIQLLPLLDRDAARRSRKPFIGYSDLTSLLTFLTTGCDVAAFHGPMLAGRLGRGEAGYHRESLLNAVCRTAPMGELAPPGLEVIAKGDASGPLFGGTISQIVASLGTPFAFSPPQRYVLFFEEVRERPYRLDRMVTQLRQAGLLARAAAVVVGELPECDEPPSLVEPPSPVELQRPGPPSPVELRRPGPPGGLKGRAVMADLLRDFPGPVVMGFPSGHTAGPAWTLPLGVACRVVADGSPRLVVEEAAVE